jgi:hypothetical protein
MNLTFDTHGQVRGLYTEALDLRTLGPLQMRRASDIEFNAATQEWEVRGIDDNQLLFTHASRESCLRWERDNLEIDPHPSTTRKNDST